MVFLSFYRHNQVVQLEDCPPLDSLAGREHRQHLNENRTGHAKYQLWCATVATENQCLC